MRRSLHCHCWSEDGEDNVTGKAGGLQELTRARKRGSQSYKHRESSQVFVERINEFQLPSLRPFRTWKTTWKVAGGQQSASPGLTASAHSVGTHLAGGRCLASGPALGAEIKNRHGLCLHHHSPCPVGSPQTPSRSLGAKAVWLGGVMEGGVPTAPRARGRPACMQ